MKNNKTYHICQSVLVLLLVAFLISSCKKTEDQNLEPPRLFKTGEISISAGETTAQLKWPVPLLSAGKPLKYTVDFSEDETFTKIVLTKIVDTAGVKVTDEDLQVKTKYFARVKANAFEDQPESKYTISSSFEITGLQLFSNVLEADLTRTGVTLRFKPTTGLTTIVLKPATGAAVNIALTATDASAGFKTITGLNEGAVYTATLLLGARSVGTIPFKTLPGLPTGTDVVYVTATDDLAAMIQAATTNKRFVVLQGTKYNSDLTLLLPAGLDISIIGEAGPVKPIISFNQITLPAVGGKLHFENVDVTGYANGDVATAKRQYLINQSTASITEEISFENCVIRNLVNTPLRLQGSNVITINKVIVNNCVVYDISNNGSNGAYAFINTNTASGKINNIAITNSTFSNVGYGLILHNSAPSVSVAVENNTFYNMVGDARYLIDYNAQVVSSSYTFKSNILGKTYSPANTGRGIRGGTTATFESNYQTSDATFSANAIPGITPYSGTSATLFTAPATLNFKIKDEAFAGKSSVGDPRWRL